MRPASHQARAQVLQARELHLEFALVAAGTLREDLQYQQCTVVHRQFQMPLQVALLGGAQGLVKQDLLGAVELCRRLDFIGLAGPHKQRCVRRPAFAADGQHRRQAGGLREQSQLLQLRIVVRQTQINPDQNGGDRGLG